MNEMTRKERLKAAGWVTSTPAEFLGLTSEESQIVELRLELSRLLREHRQKAQLSQAALAERIHSSQSRIAKAEVGEKSISFELMIRAILATGATREDIGRAISGK